LTQIIGLRIKQKSREELEGFCEMNDLAELLFTMGLFLAGFVWFVWWMVKSMNRRSER